VSASPRVSIIVPCRKERRYVADCLESIRQNDFAADSLEVLVVDGASDDGTREIIESYARQWPSVRCLDNPAGTAPAALNIGIRVARGDIIMRMDAHCHYPRNYVSMLVQWLDKSGADNVGGVCRTLPGSESRTARAIAIALSHPLGVGNSRFRIGTKSERWVDTVPFGCYRRDVFERIGLFDEDLVRNQDDEFNQRLLKNGGRILLVPDVVVDYYARDSISKVARMYYQYGYFKPLVAKKLGRIGTVRQVVPAAFVVALLGSLMLGIWLGPARLVFAGILGVYVGALLMAGAAGIPRNGFRVSVLLPLVFAVLHLSYGWGSIRGMIRFLFRRLPSQTSAQSIPVSR
jgi:glycosyltransferase involved in cell wall biosynthesis